MTGDRTIRLPYPHQGQQAVLSSTARFKWLAAGRRWRKTTLAMPLAAEGAAAGQHILWGAPTFDQCRIGWGEMYTAAGAVAKPHLGRMEMDFPNGGRVTFRSLDNPDNARGHTADGIIVDEASMVKARAWYEVLRPVISDTGGWALLQGTPKGRNWFWREWHAAADDKESEAWQIPTLGVKIIDGGLVREPHPLENPDFSFAEAQRMYRMLPERVFRQEFLAEFIDDAGGVFRNVRSAATAQRQEGRAVDCRECGVSWEDCKDQKNHSEYPHSYVAGVDWGKHNDFTVVTVLDATTNEMVAWDRFNQIDYTFQQERLKTLYNRFQPDTVIAERNAMGEPIIEQLQRADIPVQPFTTTNASKAQAVEGLALAIERGELAILNEPVLVAELQAFEAKRLPSGMLRYEAPEGMHDDCVISLALAWQAINAGQVLIGFA